MVEEEDGLVLFGGEHSIEAGRGHGLLGNWQESIGNWLG